MSFYKGGAARDSEGSNTILAFLLGAVAGGVTALLLAPAAGPETRRRISESAKRLRDDASQMAGQASTTVQESVENVRDFATTQKAAIKEAVKEAVAEGKSTYQKQVHKDENPETA